MQTVKVTVTRWQMVPQAIRERIKKVWKPVYTLHGLPLTEIVDTLEEMGEKKLAEDFEEAVVASVGVVGRPITRGATHRMTLTLDPVTYDCITSRAANQGQYRDVVKHALMIAFPEDFDQDGEEGDGPIWTHHCIRCGETIQHSGPETKTDADNAARAAGWAHLTGHWYCPACSAKRK